MTVTSFSKSSFTVGVAPETLRRTNLGDLTSHSQVNLERAVSASTRMGGHFVQGHVDTTATILSVTPDGDALTFRLEPRDKEVLRYIVEKGFITLDGASLTITTVDDEEGWFEIMFIPYTQEKIITAGKKAGDKVNVEADMTGKYVEKQVAAYFGGKETGEGGILEKMVKSLIDERLAAAGLVKRHSFGLQEG